MNSGTPEETERNKAVYNDFKQGISMIDLVVKYRISSQRIWQIIKRENEREAK